MITAGDVEVHSTWHENEQDYEVIHKYEWDPLRREVIIYEDGVDYDRITYHPDYPGDVNMATVLEPVILNRYWVEGHQKFITLYLRMATGHIIGRSFWSTDVVEEYTNGKASDSSGAYSRI